MAIVDGFFDGDEGFISPEEEARRDEEGAALGDPRRCPRHPHVVTSSPDGLFDGLCWECESAMDEEGEIARFEAGRKSDES